LILLTYIVLGFLTGYVLTTHGMRANSTTWERELSPLGRPKGRDDAMSRLLALLSAGLVADILLTVPTECDAPASQLTLEVGDPRRCLTR
jgi:hypothetical protein